MTVVKNETKKITYAVLKEMVESNAFKVDEINYNELIYMKNDAEHRNKEIKLKADKYNISALSSVFIELLAEHQTIVDIHTYLDTYMNIVEAELEEDGIISSLNEEDIDIYRNIMKLRGYSSYKSALSELSFALQCKDILKDEYEVVFMNEKIDGILAVDIVLLNKHDDSAIYCHITKDSKFAKDKLKKKSGKEVTVIDSRAEYEFNAEYNYQRKFKGHALALYSHSTCDVINDVYMFKAEYILDLVEQFEGLCSREQYDEMQYLERSSRQVRQFGNTKITWYE